MPAERHGVAPQPTRCPPTRERSRHRRLVPALAGVCIALTVGSVHAAPFADARLSNAGDEDLVSVREQRRSLESQVYTDRLIVRYRDEAAANGRRSALAVRQMPLAQVGLAAASSRRTASGAHVVKLTSRMDAASLRRLANRLAQLDDRIAWAEPDLPAMAMAEPTDPMYAQQWHYFDTKAGLRLPTAWDLSVGADVVVAVLDTGVKAHADLSPNLLAGYDFVSDPNSANDGDGRDADADDPGDGCGGSNTWHGTHVAGTVAAAADNGLGGVGVAPSAWILPVRVLGCSGGYASDIADGIQWAAGGASAVSAPSNPAQVLNMSLGGRGSCPTIVQTAIDAARAQGAVVVVAAGNSNTSASYYYPANCKGVITVAATNRGGGRAYYSNYGGVVDVAAPGGDLRKGSSAGVLSTYYTGSADSYKTLQGTSMAAPHVAGIAALLLARNPDLTPDEVEILIRTHVRAFPATCSGCGTGFAHATKVVENAYLGLAAPSLTDEVEPNNLKTEAPTLTGLPVKVRGTVTSHTDLDQYMVDVPAGQTLRIRLLNGQGSTVASSSRGAGKSDDIVWTNKNSWAAPRRIRVNHYSGSLGSYTLEVDVR